MEYDGCGYRRWIPIDQYTRVTRARGQGHGREAEAERRRIGFPSLL